MKHCAATLDCALERICISQIPRYHSNPVQFANAFRIANQGADILATLQQLSCNVPTNESGCARYQRRLHELSETPSSSA